MIDSTKLKSRLGISVNDILNLILCFASLILCVKIFIQLLARHTHIQKKPLILDILFDVCHLLACKCKLLFLKKNMRGADGV